MPRVSVIIPTFNRPDRVVRALRSVLAQSMSDLEAIVVVDGRDEASIAALGQLNDTRLIVHVPDRHLGNAGARNAGVRLAGAGWTAFLDDDDLWLPRKLEVQLETAEPRLCAWPLVACRMRVRTESAELTWPRRTPRTGEPIGDYLYRRRSLLSGDGLVQTSMVLTRTELVRRVTFTEGLERHVDPDWLLRVAAEPGVELVFPDDPAPLAVWDIANDRPRVSRSPDWRYSLQWARDRRQLLSPRAYAGFLTGPVSQSAARARQWRAFATILNEAARRGSLRPIDLVAHAANYIATDRMRSRGARLLGGGRTTGKSEMVAAGNAGVA